VVNAVQRLLTASPKYRELATGILLQYADSEMAGAAAYEGAFSLAPQLSERIEVARIAFEKLALAEKTYALVADTGINIDRYVQSHCWQSRLHRSVDLDFRRAASDKRVNALMFPVEGWADLCMFTYLMASMACLQLTDFSKSSFEPWADLAVSHNTTEALHRDFGLLAIERLSHLQREQLRLSLNYWRAKVLACFGPADSQRNARYLEFGLKTKRNEQLACEWQTSVDSDLRRLGILDS
jgi:1,2-phenylacetyl-CoA epoxidase catalytic subunit